MLLLQLLLEVVCHILVCRHSRLTLNHGGTELYILRILGFRRECTERLGVVGDHLIHVLFVEVGTSKSVQLLQFFLVVRVWSTRAVKPHESANGFDSSSVLCNPRICSDPISKRLQKRGSNREPAD